MWSSNSYLEMSVLLVYFFLIADETSPSKSCDYSGTLARRVSLEALDRLSIATERVSLVTVTHND